MGRAQRECRCGQLVSTHLELDLSKPEVAPDFKIPWSDRGTMMGLKPNMAYAAVVLTPKKVVLRARTSDTSTTVCALNRTLIDHLVSVAESRKTFRGLISTPRVVADDDPASEETGTVSVAAEGGSEAMVVG